MSLSMSPMVAGVLCVMLWLFSTNVNAQAWSRCSKSCGGGTQSKTSCVWGRICSKTYRGCNTHPCVSGWGIWQPCSRTCGGGTRFKVDKCNTNSFATCRRQYGSCNSHPCKSLKSCPRGHIFRYNDDTSCCKVSQEYCGKTSAGSRLIVGGTFAKQGQWPWTVALVNRKSKTIYCGGALVHKRWIVTAAHCTGNPSALYVLLGSVTIKSPAKGFQKRDIKKFYNHPKYGGYPVHDIALGKLKKEVKFTNNIKPVCLPSGEVVQLETTCMVIGWGRTKPNDRGSVSDRLKQVDLRILPLDACIHRYTSGSAAKLRKDQHLCAGKLIEGDTSCNGDSGGPIVCQRCSSCGWFLAATVSGGNCGVGGGPSIFMHVFHYEAWMRKFISLRPRKHFVC